ASARHPDLVRREFTATVPNRLWVTDLTFVPTWAGVAYVCFIVDAFSRMIVGWRVASHMRTEMGLDAIEMARWSRGARPADLASARHPDLVRREFTATVPNRLWVTDLTFVPTWAGVAYVCFIVDAFSRMIVGWRVASHMRTEMVLDAIEMARWSRGARHADLRCHSDAGSQFTSIRYGERLAEIGATPSIGTVGDSYDNALAETVNGYYKTELVRGPARQRPWKTVEDLELATLGWVHWHNA